MKRRSTAFLQIVIVALGIGVLFLMILEPQSEGRNAHATSLAQIYFQDPFLAYVYIASIAFFSALYQAVKLLGFIGRNQAISPESVKALRNIKYCALTLIGFILGAEAFIWMGRNRSDDIAGGVMMGVMMIFVSAVAATAAAVFERTLQSAVDIKSENDLTV
jgi:Protein of unknown function (DUF3036).